MGGNSTLAHPALEGAWGPAGGRWLCARQTGPLDPMSGPSVSSGAGAIWSQLCVHLEPHMASLSPGASSPSVAGPSPVPKPLQAIISKQRHHPPNRSSQTWGIALEVSLSLPCPCHIQAIESVYLRNISLYLLYSSVPPPALPLHQR